MKVVVFGASGRTGRLVVEQALAKKHAVTAFVRDAASLGLEHPKLRVEVGDALDPFDVARAIAGQEAVVSAIGPRSGQPQNVCSESIHLIIAEMKRQGAARLLCITVPEDTGTGFLFEQIVRPLFLKDIYADKERQEAAIYKSGLDWTIVRPPLLKEGPQTGGYRLALGTTPTGGWQISRADVAHFIVNELVRPDYVHQSVSIAY